MFLEKWSLPRVLLMINVIYFSPEMNFMKRRERRIYDYEMCDLKRIFSRIVLWTRVGPVDWTKLLSKQRVKIFTNNGYRYGWKENSDISVRTTMISSELTLQDTWMSVKAPSQPLNSLSEKQWSVYKSNRLYKRRE